MTKAFDQAHERILKTPISFARPPLSLTLHLTTFGLTTFMYLFYYTWQANLGAFRARVLKALALGMKGFSMHVGTNLTYVQAHNQRTVLDTIRLFGPLSRADVARHTNLSKKTITNIVGDLLQAQLVVQKGQRQTPGGGKPSIDLELNASGAFTIGLNLDRDRLTGVLVDLAGDIQQRVQHDLTHVPSLEEAVLLMGESVEHLCHDQKLAREQLLGVGVGLPGPYDVDSGTVVTKSDLPGWEGVPLQNMFSAKFGLPVFIENNANAAAIGERWYGAGQKVSHFLYVFFGVALGGGLVLNGHQHLGFGGFAGELADIPTDLPADAVSAPVTRLGDYFLLANLYKRLSAEGLVASSPADLETLYASENLHLFAWLDDAARHLAPVLITAEYIVDPEVVFFGGRLPSALIDHLLGRLGHLLTQLRSSRKLNQPLLLRAQAGEDAAARGVATLPIYGIFAPHPRVLRKHARGASLLAGLPLVARA